MFSGGILGSNWDKNLKTFSPCYSQSLPPADFTPPPPPWFTPLHSHSLSPPHTNTTPHRGR